MRIICDILPNPTDVVIQGEQTVFMNMPVSLLNRVLQGQVIGNRDLSNPVPTPRHMIGQHDLYGVPSEIGPMRVGGGEIVMQKIGPSPVTAVIDPIQIFINSAIPLDATGTMIADPPFLPHGIIPEWNPEPLQVTDVVQPASPRVRTEVLHSGLMAKRTAPRLTQAATKRYMMMDAFQESGASWWLVGVTKDGVGTPVPYCTVLIFLLDKLFPNQDQLGSPVIAQTTSDGTGNYMVQVTQPGPYQVYAYKSGSPDIMGLTERNLIPV